jgi:hypothetical protein
MSENTTIPVAERSDYPADAATSTFVAPPSDPPAPSNRMPLLYGLGFVILAGAIFWVWKNPTIPPDVAATQTTLRVLDQKVASMDVRLGRLEQQPTPPSAADLGKISGRIDGLESRILDQTQIQSRMDVVAGRIESLAGRDQAAVDGLKQQLDKADSQISALEASTGSVSSSSTRVDTMMRIQAAAVALANGRPLGTLPNAPPALAKYATVAPPTEGQLRLAFPQVERDALAASTLDTSALPFVDRMIERAEELMTIRRGNEVVVGNATAAVLAHADAALDAGDLAAAVKAMAGLDPGAMKAASGWIAQAKSLLDARAALTDLAAHA